MHGEVSGSGGHGGDSTRVHARWILSTARMVLHTCCGTSVVVQSTILLTESIVLSTDDKNKYKDVLHNMLQNAVFYAQ